MTDYKAPLRDIQFAMNEVLDFESHYSALPGAEDATPEMVEAILMQLGRFCEETLAPLNRSGDEEGCRWHEGAVTTPTGFKQAYQQFAEGGWTSMSWDPEFGGQGLPPSMGKILMELICTANLGFALYTSAQSGAIETLAAFGTPAQRDLYERKLIEGSWNATMCLTEPHCGTDLGLLRTKAVPSDDGSYDITGTKIFITGGEHDLNENIVHVVLARLPDAPVGTKGISLFIVPKYLSQPDGTLTERNSVSCGSIEKKMGIKASATCVMNFDGAKGFLLGELNQGLRAMFTFINASRIAASVQGISHAELGYQKSLAYARERLQMRSLSGPKNPQGPADPLIVHPDVRRMLLTQKAFTEGNRLLTYYLARQLDLAERGADEATKADARNRLDLLTPVAKAFTTETGFESANLALQCFGGHGYIREWGLEQNVRDARISTLYEGTTGIQALDLLGRKILSSGGSSLRAFIGEIVEFCSTAEAISELQPMITKLKKGSETWGRLTSEIATKAKDNPEEVGAASVHYLMFCGYVCLAYFWAQSALAAHNKLTSDSPGDAFYLSKVATARFYFDQILPRTLTCVEAIQAGSESMMAIPEEQF